MNEINYNYEDDEVARLVYYIKPKYALKDLNAIRAYDEKDYHTKRLIEYEIKFGFLDSKVEHFFSKIVGFDEFGNPEYEWSRAIRYSVWYRYDDEKSILDSYKLARFLGSCDTVDKVFFTYQEAKEFLERNHGDGTNPHDSAILKRYNDKIK